MKPFLAAALMALVAGALPAAAQTKPKREPTAAQLAARERQVKCAAEWRSAKAAKTLPADVRWPKFWSECNARMKGAKV
jgi:anti-sigma-K factor RskA